MAKARAAKLSLLNFLSLFRDLQKPTRFGGGGGVVAELFSVLQNPTLFSGVGGGGVVATSRIFFPCVFSGTRPHSVGE